MGDDCVSTLTLSLSLRIGLVLVVLALAGGRRSLGWVTHEVAKQRCFRVLLLRLRGLCEHRQSTFALRLSPCFYRLQGKVMFSQVSVFGEGEDGPGYLWWQVPSRSLVPCPFQRG